MRNKRIIAIIFTGVLILIIPLIAMQFTDQVHWTLFDFLVAGFLLITTGLLFELVFRRVHKIQHRIILYLLIIVALVLLWAELAVGIFGTAISGT